MAEKKSYIMYRSRVGTPLCDVIGARPRVSLSEYVPKSLHYRCVNHRKTYHHVWTFH